MFNYLIQSLKETLERILVETFLSWLKWPKRTKVELFDVKLFYRKNF